MCKTIATARLSLGFVLAHARQNTIQFWLLCWRQIKCQAQDVERPFVTMLKLRSSSSIFPISLSSRSMLSFSYIFHLSTKLAQAFTVYAFKINLLHAAMAAPQPDACSMSVASAEDEVDLYGVPTTCQSRSPKVEDEQASVYAEDVLSHSSLPDNKVSKSEATHFEERQLVKSPISRLRFGSFPDSLGTDEEEIGAGSSSDEQDLAADENEQEVLGRSTSPTYVTYSVSSSVAGVQGTTSAAEDSSPSRGCDELEREGIEDFPPDPSSLCDHREAAMIDGYIGDIDMAPKGKHLAFLESIKADMETEFNGRVNALHSKACELQFQVDTHHQRFQEMQKHKEATSRRLDEVLGCTCGCRELHDLMATHPRFDVVSCMSDDSLPPTPICVAYPNRCDILRRTFFTTLERTETDLSYWKQTAEHWQHLAQVEVPTQKIEELKWKLRIANQAMDESGVAYEQSIGDLNQELKIANRSVEGLNTVHTQNVATIAALQSENARLCHNTGLLQCFFDRYRMVDNDLKSAAAFLVPPCAEPSHTACHLGRVDHLGSG